MSTLDVVVAGGGPVGLYAATVLARAGRGVVVVEPRPMPVDKACGEGLMPSGLAALHAVGVDPPGHSFTGIRYLTADGRRQGYARFRDGPGRGIERSTLHTALEKAALDSGVVVIRARVAGVHQHADEVTVRLGGGEELTCQYLLAADGLHSSVRKMVGLAPGGPRRRRYGLRRHFAASPWSDLVEVHWSTDAEAYVTPVGPDTVGVAVLTEVRGRTFTDHLQAFPELLSSLAGAAPVDPALGAGPLRQAVRRRVAGRVLLVGDAAGYVDALTGEGLSIGFASARSAAHHVLTDDAPGYEASWRQLSRRYRWLTQAMVAAAGHGPSRRLVVPVAQRAPWVFARAVQALA